jgi:hypothetical protein
LLEKRREERHHYFDKYDLDGDGVVRTVLAHPAASHGCTQAARVSLHARQL